MTRPSRCIATLALACGAAMIFAACQEAPPTAPLTADVELTHGHVGYETGTCDRSLHVQLEDWYEIPVGTLWRNYSQVVTCSETEDAEFLIEPMGWGEGRVIRIIVHAGAVPPTTPGYPDILFSVRVPVPDAHLPLGGDPEPWTAIPIQFLPDMIFADDVTVELSWPEWAEEPTGTGFDLVHIDPEWHEDSEHYRAEFVGTAYYSENGLPVPPAPGVWTSGIGFKVDHFSRWTLVNGDDPDGKGVLDALGVQEADYCWTDLPPDPNRPLELLR